MAAAGAAPGDPAQAEPPVLPSARRPLPRLLSDSQRAEREAYEAEFKSFLDRRLSAGGVDAGAEQEARPAATQSAEDLLRAAKEKAAQGGEGGLLPPGSLLGPTAVTKPPRMSIAIFVVGTRGDVQPFWELGRRLLEHGHRVRLATHKDYEGFVRSGGLEFYSIGGDPKKLALYMCETGGRLMPKIWNENEREAIPEKVAMLREMMFGLWPAVTEPEEGVPDAPPFSPDAIISHPVAYGHIHVAEKLDVPLHLMAPFPFTRTGDFPCPISITGIGCNESSFLPSGAMATIVANTNRVTYMATDEFLYQGIRGMSNEFRRSLGLEIIRVGEDGAHLIHTHQVPFSYQWSPHVLARPQDYGEHIEVTGFIFNNNSPDYQPPPELVSWLEAGEPAVFVGFGSMIIDQPAALAKMIADAARKTGTRVLLQSSWSNLTLEAGKDSEELQGLIYQLGNCPHDWLFERVGAVVHHGGAGTVAAGLRAGRASLICPFFGDQHLWGMALYKAGVGVAPVPIELLTSEALAVAFCTLRGLDAQGEAIRKQASEMGEVLKKEDGVNGAVEHFYRHLPLEGMACDASLMLGPDRDPRMARWYSAKLGLKLSHETYISIGRHLHEGEGFDEYHCEMQWGFADPPNIHRGFVQGVTTAASKYLKAGAGLVVSPLAEGYQGLQEGGVTGLGGGLVRGMGKGVFVGVQRVVSGTRRVVTRPLQGIKRSSDLTRNFAYGRRLVPRSAKEGTSTSSRNTASADVEVEPQERKRLVEAFFAAKEVQRAWVRYEPSQGEGQFIHEPLGLRGVSKVLDELGYDVDTRRQVMWQLQDAEPDTAPTSRQGSSSSILGFVMPHQVLGAITSCGSYERDKEQDVPCVTFETFLNLLQPYGHPPVSEVNPKLTRAEDLLASLLRDPETPS